MGKRKLHGTSFYQCDWTGFPLKQAFCYMPEWTPTGKLQKKGSYCNWESVVAHATYLHQKGSIDDERLQKVMDHVTSICGPGITAAPHYEVLAHTKGSVTSQGFHLACSERTAPITAVKISPNGDVFEVILPTVINGGLESFFHKPYWWSQSEPKPFGGLSVFYSMRKKGQKGQDRDLAVWYYNCKDLTHNPTASNHFRMQLYGDVLLMYQSREASFLPRERWISFTKANFDEQFNKKRKRPADVQSFTPAAYGEVKAAMQSQLNQYEAERAKGAVPPAETSNVQKEDKSASGRALAAKVKGRVPSKPGALPPALFLDPTF